MSNRVESREKKIRRTALKRLVRTILAIGLILMIGCILLFIVGKVPFKYRQHRAENAFHALLANEEYNWGEIYYDPSKWDETRYRIENVPTEYIDYSIVYLDSDELPVLFLKTGAYPYAASGTSRVVIYDEESGTCRQIWGDYHSVSVVGYIPVDESHENALIFCNGGRQDVSYELIYEYHDGELTLVAQKADIYPYDSDLAESYGTHPDEYYWLGTPVNITEYYTQRGMILNGYRDIEWVDHEQ